MAARKPCERQRKGTLPLDQLPRPGTLEIKPRTPSGTLKIEDPMTVEFKKFLGKATCGYSYLPEFDLKRFIESIADIRNVNVRPPYLRIQDVNGSIYRAYVIDNSCADAQQRFFEVFPRHEVEQKQITALSKGNDRIYIFPEK